MTALVSVITPYRDAAPFLGEAIASVEVQTIPCWELLLVDDSSTDGSSLIADAAVARDSRIRRLDQQAGLRGAAAARNFGITHAIGDFLVFLDGDDRLLPTKLEAELQLMERFPEAAMTCGATEWWYPGKEYRNWSDRIRSLRPGVYHPPCLFIRAILLQRAHVPSLCAIMVRRQAIPSQPAFEPSLALYEDQSFLTKVFCNWPVYVGAHQTALYRQHRSSTSARAEEDRQYNRIGPHPARSKFLAWARTYLEENPTLLRESCEALLISEAIQSCDYSVLPLGNRMKLMLWEGREAVKRPFRRACSWSKRRYLQLKLLARAA